MAYWRLTHATSSPGHGPWVDLPPDRLRTLLARPASMSDLMHVWLLTNGGGRSKPVDVGMLRRDMVRKGNATPAALDYWGVTADG